MTTFYETFCAALCSSTLLRHGLPEDCTRHSFFRVLGAVLSNIPRDPRQAYVPPRVIGPANRGGDEELLASGKNYGT